MQVLRDLSVKAPVGLEPDGTVTMRGRDQTVINYAVGWGVTISRRALFGEYRQRILE